MHVVRLLFIGLVAVGIGALAWYPDGPPPAHTGGFGEPTCHRCHFDQPLDTPGGTLTLDGVPERYRPGGQYWLAIRLTRAGMQRGGFQLSARFEDGKRAGTFRAVDDLVEVVSSDTSAVQYVQHTRAGTALSTPDSAAWVVEWIAPEAAAPVFFHVAANAANDDASEFGDFVYLLETVRRATE